MRPAWLVLSLLAHTAAIGSAVGFAVHAGARRPAPVPPRVAVLPALASVSAPPAALPLPSVLAEPARTEEPLPDVEVAEPLEPPMAQAAELAPEATVVPSLQRVVRPLPEPVEPPPAPVAAESSATVEAVRCADNEPPRYPDHDRRLGHEGVVVLTVAIDARGDVTGVVLKVPCAHPGLNREALRAVRSWRFEPARRDGQPIGSETDVAIEFHLREPGR